MKRYRWFVRKSTFDTVLESGEIGVDDICFVLDRLRIYTKSTSFDFSNRPIYQGETNTSDSAGTWTVTIDGITELYDGLTVKVKINKAQGTSYSTLNVNNLGNVPVWFRFGVPLNDSTPLQVNDEVLLTYREQASSSSITVGGVSYVSGWIMTGSIPVTYGNEFNITSGTLGLDYGDVSSENTTKPVTGASVVEAYPETIIGNASVSNTTLTLTSLDGNEITYTHPEATETIIPQTTGKVLGSITVNDLGHVTSVTEKTLIENDIPDLGWNKITSKPTTLEGYGIEDAKIESGNITLGSETIDTGEFVTKSTAQTITGTKTFSQSIVGNVTGNATTATIAQRLASQGTSDYFYMADGSLSNGYNLLQTMMDEWSSDSGGVLASYQCSSIEYNDIFTS